MEEWRDIKGYEGIYQVSNKGRVRTVDRTLIFKDGRKYHFKSKILRQHNDKQGYQQVAFSIDGKTYQKKVHRLVAEAFIPNPNDYPMINHRDECKANNVVENLEWCTCKYNLNYGTLPRRISERVKNNKYLSKEVAQFTLDGKLIKIYPSTREVERELGFKHNGISACALGKYNKYKGYIWQYINVTNIGGQKMETL